jgi:hypothetical protein
MSSEYEVDELWCCKCEKDTVHICRYSTHERDSTDDFFACTECRWAYSGWDGKYHEPDSFSEYLIGEWEDGKIG